MTQAALIALIGRWIENRTASGTDAAPPILGLAGSQGSGKSTLAQVVAERFGGATVSLDDVYLTKAERVDLAQRAHPLFATRGPPGTHDLKRLNRLLDRLTTAGIDERTPLPRFDKLADDRAAQADWPVVEGRPRVIVIEGWCLGATRQSATALAAPVNALESEQDADGRWRTAINDALARGYEPLRARLDALVFLRAPAFDVVLDWRCEQEAKLLGLDVVPAPRRAALAAFIQHYERLTRHMIDGGVDADLIIDLDRHRRIQALHGAKFNAATAGMAP